MNELRFINSSNCYYIKKNLTTYNRRGYNSRIYRYSENTLRSIVETFVGFDTDYSYGYVLGVL